MKTIELSEKCKNCDGELILNKKIVTKPNQYYKKGQIMLWVEHKDKQCELRCKKLILSRKNKQSRLTEKYKCMMDDNYRILHKERKVQGSINGNAKRYLTKKKNKSFNKSYPEDKTNIYLIDLYGIDNVIRYYKDERYPFECDFYIPSLDLFLECNYHWTHGGHPYNEKIDSEVINKLKNKSSYYNNFIVTWKYRDVRKRQTAKSNNINYIELWKLPKSSEELSTIIKEYMSKR